MRVLHILNDLQLSGAEMMLEAAVPRWKQEGIDTHILATGSEEGPFADRLRKAGAEVQHLPFRHHPSFVVGARRRMRSVDVVHVHSERAGFLSCLAAFSASRFTVRTIHNVFPFEGSLRRRKAAERRMAALLGVVFTAPSDSVAANERERFGVAPTVIRNWVNVDRAVPSQRVEKNDPPVIITVANCGPFKNHEEMLRGLALVDEPWRFLHVGSEPDDSERRLVEHLGVAERCEFLGRRDDALDLMAAADIFLMPSLREGFSIASLEGLASGLRGVFADVPGLSDLRSVGCDIEWCGTDAASIAGAVRSALRAPRPDGERQWELVSEQHGARSMAEFADLYTNKGFIRPNR